MCYEHVNGDLVTYMKIDSINNLPAGLCWSSSVANDSLRGGYVCNLYIRGTCTAPTGLYRLRFSVSVYNNSLSAYSYVKADADTVQFDSQMRFSLLVKTRGAICPTLIDSAVAATVYPTGPVRICSYGSVTLSGPFGNGYTYHWSTGATTQNITVHTQGSYTVTVHGANGTSAVSNPVIVNVDSLRAHFVLVPDTTPHHWLAIDQSTPANTFYSRRWDWGDSTTSSSFFPFYNHYAHTYAAPGYYHVCLTVTEVLMCHSSYCDSSTYITKTDAQMAVLTLVDESEVTSGVSDVGGTHAVHVYPNPASSSLTIEAPGAMPQGAVISNELGQVVREISLPTAKTVFDARTLPTGVYTLSFRDAAVRSVRFTISK
jgi:hypothetical protein